MSFFTCGVVLYAHAGFTRAIQRDWLIVRTIGILTTLACLVSLSRPNRLMSRLHLAPGRSSSYGL
jgi:hypothetical protein